MAIYLDLPIIAGAFPRFAHIPAGQAESSSRRQAEAGWMPAFDAGDGPCSTTPAPTISTGISSEGSANRYAQPLSPAHARRRARRAHGRQRALLSGRLVRLPLFRVPGRAGP